MFPIEKHGGFLLTQSVISLTGGKSDEYLYDEYIKVLLK